MASVVLLLGWNSLGPLRSQFAYQRAIWTSDPGVKRTALEQAVRLDAAHPLVRIEKARLEGGGREALLAAEEARGLSPLFLAAGYLLRGSEDRLMMVDARHALTVACDLAVGDPLGPFFLATLQDPGDAPVEGLDLQALARALVAEPRLLVTPELLARPDIREAAVRLLEHRAEIPIGWRAALVESESRLPQGTHAVQDPLDLVLYAEESQETSLALFAFRRTALPTVLARLTIDRTLASTITMPPAADLGEFDPRLFAQGCRLEETRG